MYHTQCTLSSNAICYAPTSLPTETWQVPTALQYKDGYLAHHKWFLPPNHGLDDYDMPPAIILIGNAIGDHMDGYGDHKVSSCPSVANKSTNLEYYTSSASKGDIFVWWTIY